MLLVFLFAIVPSWAQDKTETGNKWEFTVAPYVLVPSMHGKAGLALEANINVSQKDVIESLDLGAMLYMEAGNDNWAITLDVLFMQLSKEDKTPLLERDIKVGVDQLGVSLNGLYRVASWAEVGLGVRYNSIKSNLDIAAGDLFGVPIDAVNSSDTQSWVDPLIAARIKGNIENSKLVVGMSANIGGFGIGSKFTWEVHPFVGYRFNKVVELAFAYRWLGMNYESGTSGELDYFLYDLTTTGPEIGLLLHF